MQLTNSTRLAVTLAALLILPHAACATFNLNDPDEYQSEEEIAASLLTEEERAMGFGGDQRRDEALAQARKRRNECLELNSSRRLWSTFALSMGVATGGGASGFMTLKEEALKDVSGGVAIATAAVGVVSMLVANYYTTEYTGMGCSEHRGGAY